MMTYMKTIRGIAFLALVLLLAGCSRSNHEIDSHEGHDHEQEAGEIDDHEEGESGVHFTLDQLEEFGIQLAIAGSGTLYREIDLPGDVRINTDRMAHVTPLVPGNVWKINVREGDHVRAGDVLAVLHSQQLADAKSIYLESLEQLRLADSNYQRVKSLHDDGITSVEELQSAERDLQQARIELRTAEQTLHAMNIDEDRIARLPKEENLELSHYELRAPMDGEVIRRSLVNGQRVGDMDEGFVIADLSRVWVEGDLYPRDLGLVRKGMKVRIDAGYGIPTAEGYLDYVGPIVGEETRTARVRAEIDNVDGRFNPGLFVTIHVFTEPVEVAVAVPKSALVQLENEPHLYVQEGDEYHPVQVQIGMENGSLLEIREGLEAGQTYVSDNAFVLKAEQGKSAFGDGHAH
ncbi:efflux RND transporter periplasmic adaptor subunit [bacterium]|nr:efflux RND transporter periplasmic adaptor subunit [bacterium]